ncbi:hypothetical protein GCK72_000053 [Caenorhabditis remanei]|uniref:Uncharacterized protein n=1 Tax=Caenorhabditis remanei TaxID=31234 RepID=A0A6A5HM64_CAERE|nr:hypothetical protein GCK72_000053 [Caenorhabditis remanei]KAF1768241.1 hypothetical protein GCK72_000053 [Caenorhabditis remanei]
MGIWRIGFGDTFRCEQQVCIIYSYEHITAFWILVGVIFGGQFEVLTTDESGIAVLFVRQIDGENLASHVDRHCRRLLFQLVIPCRQARAEEWNLKLVGVEESYVFSINFKPKMAFFWEFSHFSAPHRISNRPIWESLRIAQMPEIIYMTEQFLCQFWIIDEWNRTKLIQRSNVRRQTMREVGDVNGDSLNQMTSHRSVPNDFRIVEFA